MMMQENDAGRDDLPACEISDNECHGDTHQPVGHDLWFCEHHGGHGNWDNKCMEIQHDITLDPRAYPNVDTPREL